MDEILELKKDAPSSSKSGPEQPSENAKLPTEKPMDNTQMNSSEKVKTWIAKNPVQTVSRPLADVVSDSETESVRNLKMNETLSSVKQSMNDIRNSLRKRPGDDAGKKSSKKDGQKKRKECS